VANESISVISNQKVYSPPGKGENRIYRSLYAGIDPETGFFRCPNNQHIANEFLVNDKGTVKSFVYVPFETPSRRSDSIPASQKGKIVFTRSGRGEIIIHGDRPDEFNLDKALFFHQQNKSNIGKPWHVRPRTGEYTFELVDFRKKAEDNVEQIERETECRNLILGMKVPIARDTYEMIFNASHEGLTEKQVKSALYKYVENPDNAKAFLILNDSEQLEMKKIIRLCYEKGIIEDANNGNGVVWSKGKTPICAKLPKRSLIHSLMTYLVTDEGREVKKTLKELSEAE